MTTTFHRPEGRYDERRPLPRRVTVSLAVLGGALLLLLTVLAWQRFSTGTAPARLLGYRVLDDHAVEVRFEVSLATGDSLTCVLRARGEDMSEVAREEVRVGPSEDDPAVVTRTLVTTRRAVTGEVLGCRP